MEEQKESNIPILGYNSTTVYYLVVLSDFTSTWFTRISLVGKFEISIR